MNPSYFDMLGLQHSASQKDIREAHLYFSILLDNQKVFNEPFLNRFKKNIDEAYKVLIDDESRRFHQKEVVEFQQRWEELQVEKNKITLERADARQQLISNTQTIDQLNEALKTSRTNIQKLEDQLSPEKSFVISISKRTGMVIMIGALLLIFVSFFLIFFPIFPRL